jgi:hypothetical protein
MIRQLPGNATLWLMLMSDSKHRRAEEALAGILAEIETGRIKLYRNIIRQPYVFCDHPDFSGLHVHLLDKDFRGWLTHFVYLSKDFLLKEREIDRILEELAGRSLSERERYFSDLSRIALETANPLNERRKAALVVRELLAGPEVVYEAEGHWDPSQSRLPG